MKKSYPPVSRNEAILLGYLFHKFSMAKKSNAISEDGSFFVSLHDRFIDVPIDLEVQNEAITALIKRGYVDTSHRQHSGRVFYKLHLDKLAADASI